MVTLRRFTVVANWKMNVFKTDIDRLADIMKRTPSDIDLGKVLKACCVLSITNCATKKDNIISMPPLSNFVVI